MNLQDVIKDPTTVVVDVRTPAEFAGGNVVGSLNIPLNELPQRMDELKQQSNQIVLCCASGMRSANAEAFLRQQGLSNVHNGGAWVDVNYLKNN